MVDRRVDRLPLPGGAPAPKSGGSLPPLPPPPVRRHAAPREAGTTQAGAARRFTAEDSRNPCQLASSADSRAQPGPQRRGVRPLREERWSCQKRAPPDAPPDEPPPPFSVAHEYDGTSLTPGGGNRRSFRSGRDRYGVRRCSNHFRFLPPCGTAHSKPETATVPIFLSEGAALAALDRHG